MAIIDYFNIIIKPEPTMAEDVKHADLREAFKTFAIMGAIIGLMIGLIIAVAGERIGLGGIGWIAILIAPVVVGFLYASFSGFGVGLQHFCARLLGGKGTFIQLYYLASRLFWPALFASIILSLANAIPFVGILISILWWIYSGIYLNVVAISIAHRISKWRALVAFLLPMIVIGVIFLAVAGAAFFSFLALLVPMVSAGI
ncbi:MAG: Yip1 family protein [archaeon]